MCYTLGVTDGSLNAPNLWLSTFCTLFPGTKPRTKLIQKEGTLTASVLTLSRGDPS